MTCTRCHEDRPDCSIHCRRVNKDGSIYTRYICRGCRRARWGKDRVIAKQSAYRAAETTAETKQPVHFNFGINFNREYKNPIVVMPVGPKFSGSVQKIVDEGRAKNLALMLKYR